jgi:enamine deaminase RidA (YjgF/YER057c/UK114 family)
MLPSFPAGEIIHRGEMAMWHKLFRKSQSKNAGGLSRRDLVTAATAAAVTGAASAAVAQTKPAASDRLKFHNPGAGPKSTGFTQAVEAIGPGRIVYVAGQQGLDANNKVVGAPGDFRAQAEQAFVNMEAALKAAGAGWEHVVKLNHYFIDLRKHQPQLRDIRSKRFTNRPQPASTMVQVMMLVREGALYEVEAVAIVPA